MKIQWGMMMTDGRGKLGGQVASKNRAGAYVRTKVSPTNPQTSYQGLVRSEFAVLAKAWSATLNEANRKEWNEAASSGQFAKTDVFGNSKNPSGFNAYVGMNTLQNATGGAALLKPPRSASFLAQRSLSLNIVIGASPVFEAILDLESGTIQPGTVLQVQATPYVSAGKSFVKNLYRDIIVATAAAGSNTIDLLVAHRDRFGLLSGNSGKKVSVRVRQVVDGQHTSWVTATVLIQEATP